MGERIAAARGRAGLTQAELAAEVSLDRSALTKIENGSRRVSALELARIADALGERIEWFVTEPPKAIVSHRNVQEPGGKSPAIDRLIERVAWNVEFVIEHSDRLDQPQLGGLSRPGTLDEAERAADRARSLLGLDEVQPFPGIADQLVEAGLLVFSFDLGPDAADAASILLAAGGVAAVNGNLHVGRRRLAAIHEFGHYLFADEYVVDWRVADSDDANAWETRLDRFARAVLLPAHGLRQSWEALVSGGDDLRTVVVKIGSKFRVDMSTLARRLVELRIVPQDQAQRIRAVRTNRADIVEHNLVVGAELVAPGLPTPYERAVLRLYRQELVSAARAADLLFDTWEEDDLPALSQLPESAIWEFVS